MTGQLCILSGHCPLTGRYLRHACATTQPEMRTQKCKTVDLATRCNKLVSFRMPLHGLQELKVCHMTVCK